MLNLNNAVYTITTWVLPLLLSLILHEVAHGYVALKLGDKTAERAGRLTLNPFDHIDWMGTVAVPLFLLAVQAPILFGWAKPVPVNFSALNHPKRDMGLVALAGPATNFLLAVCFVIFARLVLPFCDPDSFAGLWIAQNVYNGVLISVILGIFNLFPVLPLDGGRVLAALLPNGLSEKYQETEKYGFMILLLLLFVLPFLGINVFEWFIGTLFPFFMQIINLLVGV